MSKPPRRSQQTTSPSCRPTSSPGSINRLTSAVTTDANGNVTSHVAYPPTATWEITGLEAGRLYQIVAPLSDLATADYMADLVLVAGERVAGGPHEGLSLENAAGKNLGFYRASDQDNLIFEFSGNVGPWSTAPLFIGNLLVIDQWEFETPDGSFATLESLPYDAGQPDLQFKLVTKYGDEYRFDNQGLLKSETDRLGNQTAYDYDPYTDDHGAQQNRLSKITFQGGLQVAFEYFHGRNEVQTKFKTSINFGG